MATDTWLGRAILGGERPYHPIGLPNAEYETDGYDLSVFIDATPPYDEILAVRAERVAMVRVFIADLTAQDLARSCRHPWAPDRRVSMLACLHTILKEEGAHHRYAVRDLASIIGQPETGISADD
ncbi:DinB family protein [Allobranchiibius sp. GilTou73]|uniref:DinB family protein n=1 Tax=Allobranchiibius sp. GilTou73 TaxID=2904523 RepID=UPI001F44CC61|nr:DinB family protein [Allobranchiibius sp. GilTou73]